MGKKKKKKNRKNPEPSSEEEEELGPNVFVSQNIDMPEGASLSDIGSDGGEEDDPHKALGNIVLDDILDAPEPIGKKTKKKKKSDNTDLIGVEIDKPNSPDLVEHKVHKKKKKPKKSSKKASNGSRLAFLVKDVGDDGKRDGEWYG